MAGTREAEGEPRRAVAVVACEVREAAWQQFDLDLLLKPLPTAPLAIPAVPDRARLGSVPALARTGAALTALPDGSSPKVPASAFVSVGFRRVSSLPGYPVQRTGTRRFANDNNAPAGDKRSVWRDLFFLAVLAATVVGAFWSGRLHGYQKVIVVPGPSTFYSVVT